MWVYVAFQQINRQNDQNLNNDTFVRLPVISAQVIIGTEWYPDSAILLNYNDDEYSQGYGQIKEAFKAHTKDDILQPYISEDDFRSSNEGDNIGYNIHCFDVRYQKTTKAVNQLKCKLNLMESFPLEYTVTL